MRQLICDFFNENPGHPYNYKQVSRAVNAKNDPQKIMISQILAELAFWSECRTADRSCMGMGAMHNAGDKKV